MRSINKLRNNNPDNSMNKFFSRRNHVFLLKSGRFHSEPVVIKFYSEPEPLEKIKTESRILNMLQRYQINVPSLILTNLNFIIMEYIPGTPVSELGLNINKGSWIVALAEWMHKIHNIPSKNKKYVFLKGDCNLRNFIYFKNRIYGLDFEEEIYGDPRLDLGEICFFILDVHSKDPGRWEMIKKFITAYENCSGNKISHLEKFINQSFKNAKKRRKLKKDSLEH